MSVEILMADVWSFLEEEAQLGVRLIVGVGVWGQLLQGKVMLDRKGGR
jgi:hypothetical protein